MLLTILTPTLNCLNTIDVTLESVINLESNFPGKIEHIIGDGNSTDGTLNRLNIYQESHSWASIQVLPGKNIPATLNELLQMASGRFIAVLNGDDYYKVEAMTDLLRTLEHSHGEDAIICADINLIGINGDHIGIRTCNLKQISNYMSINHPGMVVPKSIFLNYGLFDSNARYNYDYAWVWRMHGFGISFKHLKKVVAVLRLGGISERANHKAAKEIALIKFKSGAFWSSARNYFLFLCKYYAKKILPHPLIKIIIKYYRMIFGSIDPVH